ncbi:MAG: 50S ribosomal protein L3 [Patescibacteria group bacterium]
MKFILGLKKNMTQVFSENGVVSPVTVLEAGPVVVIQKKNKEKDGYNAIQVGFGNKNPKKLTKADIGHRKNLGSFRYLREFRLKNESDLNKYNVGDKIDVSLFNENDKVSVSSISKGKGFQGVVKRHGFGGGRRSHGQKHSEREPGSIAATGPQRVLKGTRMAGRMGSDVVTLKNIKVVQIDKENNLILIKGAVAGRRGTLVEMISNS